MKLGKIHKEESVVIFLIKKSSKYFILKQIGDIIKLCSYVQYACFVSAKQSLFIHSDACEYYEETVYLEENHSVYQYRNKQQKHFNKISGLTTHRQKQ